MKGTITEPDAGGSGLLVTVSRSRRGLGHLRSEEIIRSAACAAIRSEGIDYPLLMSVRCMDDRTIRRLNRRERGIDRATDVLSFPFSNLKAGFFSPEDCEMDPETGRYFLGDMAVSLERCQAQAEEYGHSYRRELSYLTIHSVLHLLGYDHIDEGPKKRRMRRREKAALAELSEWNP